VISVGKGRCAFPLGFTSIARLVKVFGNESGAPLDFAPPSGIEFEASMNKPAPKEPSMDEILSSIRQIIADDDAAVAPRKPTIPPAAPPSAAAPPRPIPNLPPMTPKPEPAAEAEPLALTPAQMLVEEQDEEPSTAISFDDILGREVAEAAPPPDVPQLVDPEDVAFEPEEPEPRPVTFAPPPVREPAPAPRPAVRPAPSVARAAPMPDPTLSRDMAEQLLAPTADAAVKHAFSRLQGVSMAGANVTLEGLMRDMLRPMLKEWLDEHLPTVVERIVEKEIARISRGGE
jgi:uncharacterized protein